VDDLRRPSSRWHSAALELLEIVLPSPCLACARPTRAWRPHLGLCVPCRGRLRPLTTACCRCGEPLAGAGIPAAYLCRRCRQHPPAFDQLLALWTYEPPLDAVVRELKFGGLAYLASHLAETMAERAGGVLSTVDLIVPVPLHWRRLLARGYNQAAEIAHTLSHRLGPPVCRALRRRRFTRAQTSLPRSARQDNLEHAFRARRTSDLAGSTVALIDDVMTTGATLESCSRALKHGGAAAVIAVVAGRTPAHAGRNLEEPKRRRELPPTEPTLTGREPPGLRPD